MKFLNEQKNKGFTLIETMIAIFVLTVAMNGLFTLISSSLFSARYAKNEITANYLVQEIVDYVHKDRDTTVFQKNGGGTWTIFMNTYGDPVAKTNCFSNNGCIIEPTKATIAACVPPGSGNFGNLPCQIFYYDQSATNKDFYTYQQGITGSYLSTFKRQVKMFTNTKNPDELDILVTAEWLNGNLVRTRSLRASLLNWKQ